ncbi:MAG: sugar-binding transcriptional regulator [Spirochaetales bacterium]|nr:sugar-binding transcriptional regulator [Spirochaetales bacterium]
MDYEEILMFKIAYYYYFEEMTQQNIAERLSISRIKVIKLLEKARQKGIIQFHLRKNPEFYLQYEQHLIKKFGLIDVFVVPAPNDQSKTNTNLAKAASLYINGRLKDDDLINVGYGDTSSHLLNNLATMAVKPISCVSLTGGVSYYLPDTRSNVFNANLHLIPAPLLASSPEMAQAIRDEATINEIFQMASIASLTVVGIGGLHENSTIFKTGTLTTNDMLYLKTHGAVGDILSHFIDKDGKLIQTDIEDRLISMPLETLKSFKTVIGVAAGEHKISAIKGALRGHYCNILITDANTAQKLLEESDD